LCKDDEYFHELTGNQNDIAGYLIGRILKSAVDSVFYTMYSKDIPIACFAISKSTKYVWFFVDKKARNRYFISELFRFIHNKLGKHFLTGTTIYNKRFIEFAEDNNWEVLIEAENEIIYSVWQQQDL
jgi:hypothetical protein